jgi:AraC family transcriptional regulator
VSSCLKAGTHGTQVDLLQAGAFLVSKTEHSPHFRVGTHMHERASVNIVLAGVYCETFRRETASVGPGTFLAKPAGEAHANEFGPHGARCLLIETGDERIIGYFPDLLRQPVASAAQMNCVHSAVIAAELRSCDALTALSVESQIIQLFVAHSREARRTFGREYGWMKRTLELLHSNPPSVLSLSEIAATVGVHPVHLARTFKRMHGVTVGSYARRLRTNRAITLLTTSKLSLSAIAADAGFSDQSHMARLIKRATGRTPSELGAWRRR